MRSALRLLEKQEQQIQALKMAIEAGIESGESTCSLQDIATNVKLKHGI